MITQHKCAQCGCNVLHDDCKDQFGNPMQMHPDATKYWKADGRPPTIIEYYCGVKCGFIKYELDNGRDIPDFIK